MNCDSLLCVQVSAKHAKNVKDLLQNNHLLEKRFRLNKVNDCVVFPLACGSSEEMLLNITRRFSADLKQLPVGIFEQNKAQSTFTSLRCLCEEYAKEMFNDNLLKEVPKKWDIHGDLVVFPHTSFSSSLWRREEFWREVAHVFHCKRVAIRSHIISDKYRTPTIELVLGDNGWVKHVDNGIVYSYDVTRNMFSKGNITEKLRVSRFNCQGEVIVDMYAGIGYFTLPYIIKTGAHKVFACDWNPHAIDALRKNLLLNNVQDKCEVLFGDNREIIPAGVADRVNLGLIPTTEPSWMAACRSLKPRAGGYLHVHENFESFTREICHCEGACVIKRVYEGSMNEKKRNCWCKHLHYCLNKLRSFLPLHMLVNIERIERVKSYAPHVDHVVLDVRVSPQGGD